MNIAGRHIRSVYFLGIGGIGMSALARYFRMHGAKVSGYDKTPSRLTEELQSEGMEIHFLDDPSQIPGGLDLVIYTPAVPDDLREMLHIREMPLPVLKRAEVLGLITRGKNTVAIAGTHGKTTITSMAAHILMAASLPVTALLGGISKNYNSNFITSGREEIMLVEADEYDRSFLHLESDVAVISSMDADHLDIYHSRQRMLDSFARFAGQVKPDGKLILRSGLEKEMSSTEDAILYSAGDQTEFGIWDLHTQNGRQTFKIIGSGREFPQVTLAVPGRHNMENAVAAAAACIQAGCSPEQIAQGLNSYRGVRRRFDIRLEMAGRIYIDDYAHHPGELDAFIQAVRELYPGRKITGIFQPHLYSRTRDFGDGFAASLDRLDHAILLDIYPAREKPLPGVSSSMILERMKSRKAQVIGAEDLLPLLDKIRPELLLTMGAGDIDLLVEPIEKLMRNW